LLLMLWNLLDATKPKLLLMLWNLLDATKPKLLLTLWNLLGNKSLSEVALSFHTLSQ